MSCVAGCPCSCQQMGCGCNDGTRGPRCSLCSGPAVEQIQVTPAGRAVTSRWCRACDWRKESA